MPKPVEKAGGGRTSSSHQQCARIRFQSYNEQLPNLSAQVIGLPLGLHQLDSADSHRPEQQLAFKVWRGGGGPASHDYTMRAEFPEKFAFLQPLAISTTEEARLLASISDTATLAFWRWWESLED